VTTEITATATSATADRTGRTADAIPKRRTELRYLHDLRAGIRPNDAVKTFGTSDKVKRFRAFQRWCIDNDCDQSLPSCFEWLQDGVSQHGWTTSTLYKYRNAVLSFLQVQEKVRDSAMSVKLQGRKRDVVELDSKREMRTAPFSDVIPLLIHKDIEKRLAMWITLLSGARSGDLHATTNSPPLTIDRVNTARSDARLLTLNFNGITKTTMSESALLREDHLVFVALPQDLHDYVLEKKRRFAPSNPLLLPSTKFSPSHLYKHCAVRLVCDLLAKLRITKFHVLRDIFAKHLSVLNPRHTSATYMDRSNSEAALVSRGMDALAILLSYHVQREANLIRSIKDNFAFSTEDIDTAIAVLREKA
jgi:hypothetical protein